MSRKHVLVVDPNPSTRAVVRIGLEEFGFEIHECSDLSAATQLVNELAPEAMVVGLDLSAQETLNVVEEWRSQLPRPVSVVALLSNDAIPENSPPGVRWLRKPFGLTSLVAALYQSLGLKVA
jgi:DNA-binding response OmpR family regulator